MIVIVGLVDLGVRASEKLESKRATMATDHCRLCGGQKGGAVVLN